MPFDSETLMVISSISRICRSNLSEVVIGVELYACIHRRFIGECAYVYMSVCIYTAFLKHTHVRYMVWATREYKNETSHGMWYEKKKEWSGMPQKGA